MLDRCDGSQPGWKERQVVELVKKINRRLDPKLGGKIGKATIPRKGYLEKAER
jgi:hypothetical protein